MSYQAKWTISGTTLENSADALTKATKAVENSQILKKHQAKLNKHFQENISTNLRRAGLDADNFDDVFFLKIANGSFSFVNTEPLITQRYEYGYYDEHNTKNNNSNNTNSEEDYYEEYLIETSPRYFIRPAIQESLNEIGNLITHEVTNEYMNNRRQVNGDEI